MFIFIPPETSPAGARAGIIINQPPWPSAALRATTAGSGIDCVMYFGDKILRSFIRNVSKNICLIFLIQLFIVEPKYSGAERRHIGVNYVLLSDV